MQFSKHLILALIMVLLAACEAEPAPTAVPAAAEVVASVVETAVPTPTPLPTTTPTDQPAIEPTATETAAAEPFTGWPAPAKTKRLFSQDAITADEQRTLDDLVANLPPERDPAALAMAYNGLTAVSDPTPALVTEPLAAGTRQQFNVLNVDSITIETIEAELQAVGDHAYFWLEVAPDLTAPDKSDLIWTADTFDDVYEQVTAIFGSEANPGIDGDPRIHILSASPLTICDAEPCGILGYFSSGDTVPVSVDPQSNEREMFVMNGRYFGTPGFIDTLAHEFRHMVEANYDANDIDWAVEGSAMLAEDLLGFSADPVSRANLFLSNPDQQLNSWPETGTISHYGQGYLLNRYIYNRLGPDLYREFATHSETGLDAVTAVAAAHNLDFDGESLWLDWLAALAIHDRPGADAKYALTDGVSTAAMTTLTTPGEWETAVSQYAADYYQLDPDQKNWTIAFTGSSHTPVIPVQPVSGSQMWLANRANYSQAQLTRAFDLRGVASTTLNYAVYHDIERGYDFAYLSVSNDGGQTWQPLTAPNMQGLEPHHDPSHSAFADRFYTDNSGGWVEETIDLTPFAGQEILLRFEYVTDPILTHSGLALDNISIPEIGYYDDAETDQGWQANGFVRATGNIPQPWHLLLITFPDGVPQAEILPLDGNQSGAYEISAKQSEQPPILIVAAAAPMTLQPAQYQLETIN